MEENIVIPNLNEDNRNQRPAQNKQATGERKASMIVSIVMFFISLAFSAVTFYYLLTVFMTKDKATSAIAFYCIFIHFWLVNLSSRSRNRYYWNMHRCSCFTFIN